MTKLTKTGWTIKHVRKEARPRSERYRHWSAIPHLEDTYVQYSRFCEILNKSVDRFVPKFKTEVRKKKQTVLKERFRRGHRQHMRDLMKAEGSILRL